MAVLRARRGEVSPCIAYDRKKKTRKQTTYRYAKSIKKNEVSFEEALKAFKKHTPVRTGYAKNKVAVIVIGLILILMILLASAAFVGVVAGGVTTAIASTTYPSKDRDISDSEEAYEDLEDALNSQINKIETTHPGYDEYIYQVDEIGHNPYELISYLTVRYGSFKYADIKEILPEIFKRQYTLTVREEVQIRTRKNKDGEDEEYEWQVLYIRLTNRGIRSIAEGDFSPEKLKLFDTYTNLHGNRDGIFNENIIPKPGMEYEIPPEALSDERFARMITEAEKYLGYPYVWGGSNPHTSFDCSGFVSWVINNSENGWDVGRSTAEGLRTSTAYVSPQDARPGDLIFFQGTYNTSGASHVGIYVGDGMMIHCGNPIQYASINTPYWQNHFYQFGRLP